MGAEAVIAGECPNLNGIPISNVASPRPHQGNPKIVVIFITTIIICFVTFIINIISIIIISLNLLLLHMFHTDLLSELNEWGPVFTLWSNSEDKLNPALSAVAKSIEKCYLSLQELVCPYMCFRKHFLAFHFYFDVLILIWNLSIVSHIT